MHKATISLEFEMISLEPQMAVGLIACCSDYEWYIQPAEQTSSRRMIPRECWWSKMKSEKLHVTLRPGCSAS